MIREQFFEPALNRLRRKWGSHRFASVAAGILATKPLKMQGNNPIYVSLLCRNDVHGYLLALKTLYSRMKRGRVLVIDDGSLGPSERECLAHHIPGIEIVPLDSIDTDGCPRGGCWERLAKIVELSRDGFVIQVDADTLVVGDIVDVERSVAKNRSFLLGTQSGIEIGTAAETARMVQTWINSGIWKELPFTVNAEASLLSLPDAERRRYVHASAGFAGFARGAFRMEDLKWFSAHMSKIVGSEQWARWGSEQIASNFLLSNATGAQVLPFPRYACFEPNLPPSKRALLHFVGTHRYQGGEYRRMAAIAILDLSLKDS